MWTFSVPRIDGLDVVQHVFHRDGYGGVVAEHDLTEAVADEDDVNARTSRRCAPTCSRMR